MVRALLPILPLLTVEPAVAQNADCARAETQAQLTACVAADGYNADARLNLSFGKRMRALSPASQALLKESQRAWIAFRDRECRFRAGGAQRGSVAPMLAATCAATLSRTRARDLDALGACIEGDIACPR